jgi:hypothetical protein
MLLALAFYSLKLRVQENIKNNYCEGFEIFRSILQQSEKGSLLCFILKFIKLRLSEFLRVW